MGQGGYIELAGVEAAYALLLGRVKPRRARGGHLASGRKEPSAAARMLLRAADEVARVCRAMKSSSSGCKHLFPTCKQPRDIYIQVNLLAQALGRDA